MECAVLYFGVERAETKVAMCEISLFLFINTARLLEISLYISVVYRINCYNMGIYLCFFCYWLAKIIQQWQGHISLNIRHYPPPDIRKFAVFQGLTILRFDLI